MECGISKNEYLRQKCRTRKFYLAVLSLLCVVSVLVLEQTVINRSYFDPHFKIHINVTVSDQRYYEVTTFPSDIQYSWSRNETKNPEMFILSAIGINFSKLNDYHAEVKISGWMALGLKASGIKCCFLMNSGALIEHHRPSRSLGERVALTSSQTTCPVESHIQDVKGVTLQFAESKCSMNTSAYIKPSVPIKPTDNESFAICLKILFGQINVGLLVEWLEYNRLIGVDKIFMFTYNLKREVRDVLRQYVKAGFVETRPYKYPKKKYHKIGTKIKSFFEDEQVAVYDCYERLSLYKYFSIIDMDEFIVPRKHDNIKNLMRYLMTKYPLAGGFQMTSYLFVKDIDQNGHPVRKNSNIGSYFKRFSFPKKARSRSKNILLPSRTSTIRTHTFSPVLNYAKIKINASDVSLNHYRKCYTDLRKFCKGSAVNDTYILKFLNRLNEKNQIVHYN
ncbi:hypothetical protein ACF0H5_002423 [Mactra antiquata]